MLLFMLIWMFPFSRSRNSSIEGEGESDGRKKNVTNPDENSK